mmetsp:Transcript_34083/g.105287  ORF Transcript_34083/g.105287 Transcript_34083/m.105287 type:complete len:213 (+) Transcript_34083:474-1112(+)
MNPALPRSNRPVASLRPPTRPTKANRNQPRSAEAASVGEPQEPLPQTANRPVWVAAAVAGAGAGAALAAAVRDALSRLRCPNHQPAPRHPSRRRFRCSNRLPSAGRRRLPRPTCPLRGRPLTTTLTRRSSASKWTPSSTASGPRPLPWRKSSARRTVERPTSRPRCRRSSGRPTKARRTPSAVRSRRPCWTRRPPSLSPCACSRARHTSSSA